MDTKQISITPFAMLSFFFGIAAPILFAIAIFADGSWTFGVHTLSRLGVSQSIVAANIFNYTLIFGGIIMTIAGIGMFIARKDRYGRISSILLTIGMIAIIFVGIFKCDTWIHNAAAYIGFALLLISMFVYGYASSVKGRWLAAGTIIGLVTILIASLPGSTLPAIEVVAFACLCVWIMIQGLSDAFGKDRSDQ